MHFMNKERSYDVVIIGGGIAGISCAYNCAKNNLKTLLVEKNNYLGGLTTGGLVVPSMKSNDKNINTDFYNELVKYSKLNNAQITYGDGNKGWFNPILLKIVYEQMLKKVGVDILYESTCVDFEKNKNNIKKIKIESELLSLYIYSSYFIDATGSGKFSKILKCDFIKEKNKFQKKSLRFLVSNVDLEKFSDFILKIDNNRDVTTSFKIDNDRHLSTAYTSSKDKKWALEEYFNKAIEDNVLKPADTEYFQLFTVAKMPSTIAFNCPYLNLDKDYDLIAYSNALIEAREAMVRLLDFCKKYLKGFENAYISNIADITGNRENGRVKTKYIYKINDIINEKRFKNEVLSSDYPIDIHSDDDSKLTKYNNYYLPIESLMSTNYDNLFIIGRCLGADFESHSALRVQTSCASMGEGVAKYIAAKIK
ncbi:MAG: FAD-dependent oxidoreductase [Cyanobacteria bacterium SIG30]|nr:FAD-dependent oxidoreductase [Cyanobacteria bacterium SIG30]